MHQVEIDAEVSEKTRARCAAGWRSNGLVVGYCVYMSSSTVLRQFLKGVALRGLLNKFESVAKKMICEIFYAYKPSCNLEKT